MTNILNNYYKRLTGKGIIKVVKWISSDEAANKKVSIGGMGGWFNSGQIHGPEHGGVNDTWEDYVNNWRKKVKPYARGLFDNIVAGKIRMTGEQNQDVDTVPLFEDGTIGEFTWRAWGDLMAAVWSKVDGKNYSYMDFYM
jgi:hypothetical protein